ncbi:hypothetical protein [Nonomuraea jabiensis]|uniref:hypothetical protein n=1 Tax=Nonomuraea jabiensis TaxID=882448 RepID=UPI003D730248
MLLPVEAAAVCLPAREGGYRQSRQDWFGAVQQENAYGRRTEQVTFYQTAITEAPVSAHWRGR